MASQPLKSFKSAALIAAIINGSAAVLMLVALRDGLLPSIDIHMRIAYINSHLLLWKFTWCVWIGAAISLIYFFVQWGLWLDERSQQKRRALIIPGVLLASLGLTADTIAEVFFISYVPQLAEQHLITELQTIEPFITMMTGFLGNGLYCLGGLFLSLASFKCVIHSKRWFVMGLPIWIFGLGLSWSAIAESALGLEVTTALTMTTFIVWSGSIGLFFPKEAN